MTLNAGENKDVTVTVEPLFLSTFDPRVHGWHRAAGTYTIMVGGSSENLPLKDSVLLP